MGDRKITVAAVVLVALVLLTYRTAPDNGFRFDDGNNIVENESVHMESFSLDAVAMAARGAHARRPLAGITFAIDWWRGGGQARAFLWTNLCIHVINTLLVFWLLMLILPAWPESRSMKVAVATGTAAIWGLHPIQVQAVSYIVQRMASLATLCVLFAVIAYLMGRAASEWRQWAWWAAGTIAALLGVYTKEIAYVLPILIIVAEYGFVRRDGVLIRGWIDRVVLSVPVILLAYLVLDIATGLGPVAERLQGMYSIKKFSLEERLLTQSRVVCSYLGQWLWPAPGRFAAVHDVEYSKGLLSPWTTLTALLGVMSWVAAATALAFRRTTRGIAALLFWVPITLGLESTVIPLIAVFEHRMYLPTVALAGLLGFGLTRLATNTHGRSVVLASMALLVAALALITPQVVANWRSDISMWKASARHAPKSHQVWNNLGTAYASEQEYGSAIDSYLRALGVHPDDDYAFNNLRRAMLSLGVPDAALAETLRPQHGRDWVPIGRGLAHLERHDAAIEALTRGTGIEPDHAELWTARGWVWLKLKRPGTAEPDLDRALALDAQSLRAREGRAMARYANGRYEEALSDCAEIERLDPEHGGMHLVRGASLHFLGRDDEAAQSLTKACQRGEAQACDLRESLDK